MSTFMDTTISARFKGVNDDTNMFDWEVTLTRNGKAHTTPYGMGFAHCKRVKSPSGNAVKLDNHKLARAVLGGGRRLTISDTEGYVAPNVPTLTDVLQCLQSDARSGEHMLFEDFASEFGYDTDSRAAEKIWRTCQETRGKLQKFFGTDFETFMNHNFDE